MNDTAIENLVHHPMLDVTSVIASNVKSQTQRFPDSSGTFAAKPKFTDICAVAPSAEYNSRA